MASKTVRYIGPLRAVELVVDGVMHTIAHGESIELATADANSLLDQPDNWQTPKPGPAPQAKDKE